MTTTPILALICKTHGVILSFICVTTHPLSPRHVSKALWDKIIVLKDHDLCLISVEENSSLVSSWILLKSSVMTLDLGRHDSQSVEA